MSPQVLNEMYWIGRQKFPQVPIGESQRFVSDFVPNCTAPMDTKIMQEAFSIEQRYGLSWCNCLIVSSALASRCHLLLTEDMQHGMTIENLTILSPFRSSPAQAISRT